MASESRSGLQEGNRVRVLPGAWEMWKGTGDTEQPSEGEWKSSCLKSSQEGTDDSRAWRPPGSQWHGPGQAGEWRKEWSTPVWVPWVWRRPGERAEQSRPCGEDKEDTFCLDYDIIHCDSGGAMPWDSTTTTWTDGLVPPAP